MHLLPASILTVLIAAYVEPVAAETACYKDNVYYYASSSDPNNLLVNQQVTEPAHCQIACQGNVECRVWMWRKSDNTCTLMLDEMYKERKQSDGSYISGPKYCPGTCVYYNQQYRKGDIGKPRAAKTVRSCLWYCMRKEGVTAWLFIYSNGKGRKAGTYRNCHCQHQVGDEARVALPRRLKTVGGDMQPHAATSTGKCMPRFFNEDLLKPLRAGE